MISEDTRGMQLLKEIRIHADPSTRKRIIAEAKLSGSELRDLATDCEHARAQITGSSPDNSYRQLVERIFVHPMRATVCPVNNGKTGTIEAECLARLLDMSKELRGAISA